jgi:DNA-binding transcriptional ArsR family regulator
VTPEKPREVLTLDRLRTIGVTLLSEWDALVFLYRHPASLGTAAQIARLIGYDKTEIGAALNRLETLGLIRRSRDSQGIRLYRFSEPEEPSRRSSLVALMTVAQNRDGRLLLLNHLKRTSQAARRAHPSGLRLA